jgi:hypothetical protein
MSPDRFRPALALSAFTVLVWTTRIRNIWTDDELSTVGQVGRTALALAFTAFAVATVAAWVRARRAGILTDRDRLLVRIFAVWTSVVWVVRGVQIAVADHGGAFVAVHTALAVASIALAVWADRRVHGPDRTGGAPVLRGAGSGSGRRDDASPVAPRRHR